MLSDERIEHVPKRAVILRERKDIAEPRLLHLQADPSYGISG